jgi:hypothetical protein
VEVEVHRKTVISLRDFLIIQNVVSNAWSNCVMNQLIRLINTYNKHCLAFYFLVQNFTFRD